MFFVTNHPDPWQYFNPKGNDSIHMEIFYK